MIGEKRLYQYIYKEFLWVDRLIRRRQLFGDSVNNKSGFEQVPCAICGNKNLHLLYKHGQFGLPCHVSICPSDGFVFLSPRWSKDRYKYFYENEYDSYYRSDIFSDQIDTSKYQNIQTICKRLEQTKFLRDITSVMDVGAGMGWSLEWLKSNYPQIKTFAAIESSAYCQEYLKSSVKADVLSDDIDSDWSSSGFDLVIMRHVLEHFLDPVKALKKIAASVNEKGIVYIAVPDMMNPKRSLTNYWFRIVHTYYFSEKTLAQIALLAGLQPVQIVSDTSELWGIFQKSENIEQRIYLSDVYEDQIKIIQYYKRKFLLVDVKYDILRLIARLLPQKVKTHIKFIKNIK